MSSPEIKFERFERICDSNKNRRVAGDTRSLIYDFKVFIDGEHRANMDRCVHRPGYYVRDADGQPIRTPDSHRQIGGNRVEVCDKQANFSRTIETLLSGGFIPTLVGLAAAKADRAEKAEKRKIEQREQYAVDCKKYAGPALFDALMEIKKLRSLDGATIAACQQIATDALENVIKDIEGYEP